MPQLLFNGIAIGCIYALIALGVVNSARGDLLVVGSYIGVFGVVEFGWPIWATVFSHQSRHFSFDVPVVVRVSLLVGGAGTIIGAVVGKILMTFLPEWLRVFQDYQQVSSARAVRYVLELGGVELEGACQDLRSDPRVRQISL